MIYLYLLVGTVGMGGAAWAAGDAGWQFKDLALYIWRCCVIILLFCVAASIQ